MFCFRSIYCMMILKWLRVYREFLLFLLTGLLNPIEYIIPQEFIQQLRWPTFTQFWPPTPRVEDCGYFMCYLPFVHMIKCGFSSSCLCSYWMNHSSNRTPSVRYVKVFSSKMIEWVIASLGHRLLSLHTVIEIRKGVRYIKKTTYVLMLLQVSEFSLLFFLIANPHVEF